MRVDTNAVGGRVCPKCGWYYPPSSKHLKKCKFCGTIFDAQVCKYCNETFSTAEAKAYSDTPGTFIARICPTCAEQVIKLSRKELNTTKFNTRINCIKRLHEMYNTHISFYKKLHTKNTTISRLNTELVRNYRGCFFCMSQIDSYRMIIPPADGGRYDEFNVIPLCKECAKMLDYDKNILVAAEPLINKKSKVRYSNKLKKMLILSEEDLEDAKKYKRSSR